jgi:hypothetical protein
MEGNSVRLVDADDTNSRQQWQRCVGRKEEDAKMEASDLICFRGLAARGRQGRRRTANYREHRNIRMNTRRAYFKRQYRNGMRKEQADSGMQRASGFSKFGFGGVLRCYNPLSMV